MWMQSFLLAIVAVVASGRGIRNSPTIVNKYGTFHDYKTTDFKDISDAFYWMNIRKQLNLEWLSSLFEPSPVYKFPFESSIVDRRTMKKPEHGDNTIETTSPDLSTAIKNELEQSNEYLVSTIDPRTVNKIDVADALPPVIQYPFKEGIVDPRTVQKTYSSNTNIIDSKPLPPTDVVNARAPIIRYPFRVGIVDPRTVMDPASKNTLDNEPAPDIKHRF